ncbi:MAG TPA: DUF4394 domain-containing protein [Herpetosiphonaceae bacterium]
MKRRTPSSAWKVFRAGLVAMLLLGLALASRPAATQAYAGEVVYAVTTGNQLIQFNSANPSLLTGQQSITGLGLMENVIGIDFRPANGDLLAVTNQSRIYVINRATGAATVVSATPFTPALTSTNIGMDFNPSVDRIRVVNTNGQNLRLHPVTGAVAGTDTTLAYAAGDPNNGVTPQVAAAAYTRNISGTVGTSLYVVDANLDILALQGSPGGSPSSPNTGQLTTVGALGANVNSGVSFDIAPSGAAFVAYTPAASLTSLFAPVDLATGRIGQPQPITTDLLQTVVGIAIPTRPNLPGQPIYAATTANQLVLFSSANPGRIITQRAIGGLQVMEVVAGMDFRPATGKLLAVTNFSRMLEIDPATGATSPIGTQPFSPTLSGGNFGMDFNPSVDRIRMVSNTGQNLRLNPINGTVAGVDTALSYNLMDPNAGQTPQVVGAAYTRNISPTVGTSLYVIDSNLDILALQGGRGGTPSPNGGVLSTVGALGVSVNTNVSFDISVSGAAFISYGAPMTTTTQLGTVDLLTGRVQPLGATGTPVTAIAVPTQITGPERRIVGATSAGRLLEFSSAAPETILSDRPITGLQPEERLVGMDFRPATGQLFAVGSSSRVYLINQRTGAATMVGSGPFSPALNGSDFGVDFNPAVDRIRLVSTGGQNLRLNPITGAAVTPADTSLAYVAGDLNAGRMASGVAAAYTNNISGTATTSLFVLDSLNDALALQGGINGVPSPNTGALTTVGPTFVDITDSTHFDIDPTGVGYVTVDTEAGAYLATIDLGSGRITPIGRIGAGVELDAMAIAKLDAPRYLPLIFKP